MNWRSAVVVLTTGLLLTLIACAFWIQDWRYSLPAERPAGLREPSIGERVAWSPGVRPTGFDSPVFLHFFNPDCPCSRFNVDHIRELVRRHKSDVRFVAVLQGERSPADLRAAFEENQLGIEAVVDEDGSIGRAVGIYATPQAVVIDRNSRLYYRGNYNQSRYCTVPETEFARIALESLLAGKPAETSGGRAAFGCPIPKRNKLKLAGSA